MVRSKLGCYIRSFERNDLKALSNILAAGGCVNKTAKTNVRWHELTHATGQVFVLLTATCLLSWSLPHAAFADQDADNPVLSRLETKLFQHRYPNDSLESRLDRLEKMVFGEGKSGSEEERIKNLLSSVPMSDSKPSDAPPPAGGNRSGQESALPAGDHDAGQQAQAPEPPVDASNYPAVTAIERKLFGKEYSGEPVIKRLERLETKVFGHPSGIDDLSERVDRLKQRTGIDIAKQAPPGTDWADDDDLGGGPVSSPIAGGSDDDGQSQSLSRRNPRSDLRYTPDEPGDRWAGTGSYGMGSGMSPVPRSSRAFTPPSQAPAIPPNTVPGRSGFTPPAAMGGQPLGLNQQVGALEQEIWGRTYVRDPLPSRLSRLESTVFPKEKPATDKSLPERVSRLLSVVPLSPAGASQRSIAQTGGRQRTGDPDFDDLDDMVGGQTGQNRSAGGGLSKIINSIGSLLTGGYTGGYPMAPGGMITDPQTGLWLDPRTGSLIDPVTGAVVGQRAVQPGVGSTMNGFGSFSNGFAPYGTAPYGTGYGTGMHFGFGGIGRYGYGGLWP